MIESEGSLPVPNFVPRGSLRGVRITGSVSSKTRDDVSEDCSGTQLCTPAVVVDCDFREAITPQCGSHVGFPRYHRPALVSSLDSTRLYVGCCLRAVRVPRWHPISCLSDDDGVMARLEDKCPSRDMSHRDVHDGLSSIRRNTGTFPGYR